MATITGTSATDNLLGTSGIATGDAVANRDSTTFEFSDISIGLCGVSAAQLLAGHFVF